MEYFFLILPKLATFFLLILLGILMVKVGVVTRENLSLLSGLIVKLILPCLILSLVWENQTTLPALWGFRRILLGQASTYFLLLGAGLLIIRHCRLTPPTSNTLFGCIIGGNYGFVVIPLMMALFPAGEGQQYIPVCAAIDTLFVWTLGMYLFTNVKGRNTLRENPLKKVLNPVFVTFLAALVLCTLKAPLPDPVVSVFDQLGSASCLGLVYLGCSLCFVNRSALKKIRPLLLIILLRQLLLPLAIHLISRPFLPDTERMCVVLITAAPSLSAASMIARQYQLDEDFASSAVFLTTAASGVTIPLVFYLMAIL